MSKFDAGLQLNEKYEQQAENGFENIIKNPKKIDGKELTTIGSHELYAAPEQWERLEPISKEELLRLIDSIMTVGLQSPVVLWQIPKSKMIDHYSASELGEPAYGLTGENYMVLSGHNRIKAYKAIYEKTNQVKYETIPAYIYTEKTLSLINAQNIVIDTNANQRGISVAQRDRLFERKFFLYLHNSDEKVKGKTDVNMIDRIAEEMEVSPKTVYVYRKLQDLYTPLRKLMVASNTINISYASYISHLSIERQQWLYENYKEYLSSALLKKIKPYMTNNQIKETLDRQIERMETTKENKAKNLVTLTFQVPKELKKEATQMFEEWLAEHELKM